jgi:adenylate cyclase
VDIVVSEYTRKQVHQFKWLELDRIRVKGKQEAVTIYTPIPPNEDANAVKEEMMMWSQFLGSYRVQDWDSCDVFLLNLSKNYPRKGLYQTYIERINSFRLLPFDPDWDGIHRFDTK